MLRDRSGEHTRTGRAGDRPGTDTLADRLRRLRPSDEEEDSQLMRTLHSALGSRVTDRVALLCGQLTSPDPLDRCNAVWMSAGLSREWRTSGAEPVGLIGAQLGADRGPVAWMRRSPSWWSSSSWPLRRRTTSTRW
ncbi:hypothetical protein SPURM210S_08512 [Streptomyces purpurascens]